MEWITVHVSRGNNDEQCELEIDDKSERCFGVFMAHFETCHHLSISNQTQSDQNYLRDIAY